MTSLVYGLPQNITTRILQYNKIGV